MPDAFSFTFTSNGTDAFLQFGCPGYLYIQAGVGVVFGTTATIDADGAIDFRNSQQFGIFGAGMSRQQGPLPADDATLDDLRARVAALETALVSYGWLAPRV